MDKGVKKTNWQKVLWLVLLGCCVVGFALTAALFFGKASPAYASATLVLTFDGAADGVAPNGAAFNIRDITSDEVLREGLQNASMEDVLTPEQIRANLVAAGVFPEDLAEQAMTYESILEATASRQMVTVNYRPTTFLVSLYNDFDKPVSKTQLMSLLEGIMKAYGAYFSRVYANGLDVSGSIFVLDTYNYPQQAQIIQQKLTALSEYADELYAKAPTFRLNGAGFNDISVRFRALIDSRIDRISAEASSNALMQDPGRQIAEYQFEIRTLSNQLNEKSRELEQMDHLIASYEKNGTIYLKTTTDTLTEIDGNSSKTYDTLMQRRKEAADGINKIQYQIANYKMQLADLMDHDGDEPAGADGEKINARRALLEESISKLVSDSDAVVADFKTMLAAYNARQINGSTVSVVEYKYKAPTVLSGAFAKQAIITAGPVVVLGLMVCAVLIILQRRKEVKS